MMRDKFLFQKCKGMKLINRSQRCFYANRRWDKIEHKNTILWAKRLSFYRYYLSCLCLPFTERIRKESDSELKYRSQGIYRRYRNEECFQCLSLFLALRFREDVFLLVSALLASLDGFIISVAFNLRDRRDQGIQCLNVFLFFIPFLESLCLNQSIDETRSPVTETKRIVNGSDGF